MAIESHRETVALRTAVRELVALSAMPVAWVGREPPAIAGGLADVLVGSFNLDFAFVRLCDPNGGAAIEVTRGHAWKAFPEWLRSRLNGGRFSYKEIITDLDGTEPCGGVAIPIGVNAEAGLVAAACSRHDFPSEIDQLLLSVAANHAAAAFQSARLRSELAAKVAELRQAGNELEMKVTERTAELRRATAELQTILDASPVGIALFSGDQAIQRCNPAFERISGWRADEIAGHPVSVLETDRNQPSALAEKLHAGEAFANVETRLVRKDGTEFDAAVSCAPLQDEAGSRAGFVGTIEDISDRKQAEEERRAHLEFFESLDRINRAIQGTNDLEQMMSDVLDEVLSIFNCDRAWLVYPCDPEAASWGVPMEHTRPEFPGAFALQSDMPMDPDIVELFQAVRACSGPVRFGPGSEHPLPTRVATRFNVRSQLSMAIYPKEERPYLFGLHQCSYPRVWTLQEERLFQEIGRRLADALTSLLMFRNLRESEARLEEAQRIAHVGHWERDLETNHITCSDETYRIYGLAPQDGTIDITGWLELIHPDDRHVVVEASAKARRGGARYEVEYRVVRPNGDVRIVRSHASVGRDASGAPHRIFGIIQDITEQKRAEAELRQAHADLAYISRVTTMGELTASLAHEIKQPITAAVTDAKTCLRWLGREKPDVVEAREAASRTVKDVRRAADIISSISMLFTKGAVERQLVDVNELIREMILLLRNEANHYSISIRTELDPDLPNVVADRVQLQQVFMNLMLNGIDAMKETSGGNELTIRSEADNSQLVISVSDTGVGLPPDQGDQIFSAFFTTKDHGTGMGLPISRSIIESHGGRLWAAGNSGRGATFQFSLPVAVATHA